jgi:hypothetical protein
MEWTMSHETKLSQRVQEHTKERKLVATG